LFDIFASWPASNGSPRYGRRRFLFNATAASLCGLAPFGAKAQAPQKRLLLLGDSLTAGYGLPANQAFPARLDAALRAAGISLGIVNAGVSGDTSAGGLARLDWALGTPPFPEYALVILGANDGLRGLDVAAMERNLDQIVERLKARGVRTMLSGMRAPPNMGSAYTQAFARSFSNVALKHGVPLDPFFLEGVAAVPALNQPDGIHPNAAGVDAVVARLLPALRAFLTAA
jgi:acyl-CoA thioesterase I